MTEAFNEELKDLMSDVIMWTLEIPCWVKSLFFGNSAVTLGRGAKKNYKKSHVSSIEYFFLKLFAKKYF